MAMRNSLKVLAVTSLLAGCASAPLAPRVAVMPAPGKSFEQFVAEERLCRQWAEQSVGIGQDDPGLRTSVDSAVIGTAIGAVAGAAFVEALNPPFIPFSSSGATAGGALTLP